MPAAACGALRFLARKHRARLPVLFVNRVWLHHASRSGYRQLSAGTGSSLPLGVALLPRRLASWLASAGGHAKSHDLLMMRLALLIGRTDAVHVIDGDHRPWWFNPRPAWLKTRLIATFHQPPDRLEQRAASLAAASLDGAIAVARCQIPVLERTFGRGRVWYIPHGVDCAHFRPAANPPDRRLVISVGTHRRDYATFVRTAALIRAAIPDAVIRVYGSRSHLPAVVRDPAIEVRYDVPDAEIFAAYRSAAALLLPLEASSANNVLLEAMACGLPVVVSNVDGAPDYVEAGAGFLCERGDARAHADAAIALMTDPALRQAMGRKARLQAEKFDWKIVRPALLQRLLPQETRHAIPRGVQPVERSEPSTRAG